MENFVEKILKGIENLKTLEIRTVVGNFEWDETEKKIKYPKDVKLIMTQIDLLDGDITTAFSEEFLKPPFDEIRKFHAEREKQGQQIIDGNIKALRELISLFIDACKGKKEVDRIG